MVNPVSFWFHKHVKGITPSLIQIANEDMEDILYLTDNNQDLEYKGHIYKSAYIKINPPKQTTDSVGNASMTIGCVDQQMIQLVRELKTPPIVSFVASYLEDGVFSELMGYDMLFKNISWDASTMSGDLTLDSLLMDSFPSGEFTPFTTTGIA